VKDKYDPLAPDPVCPKCGELAWHPPTGDCPADIERLPSRISRRHLQNAIWAILAVLLAWEVGMLLVRALR